MPIERALTVRDVAEQLNVKPITVYRLAAAGRIPHWRIGACLRFSPAKIAAYLAAHEIAGGAL